MPELAPRADTDTTTDTTMVTATEGLVEAITTAPEVVAEEATDIMEASIDVT